jgi:hypothetical protein
MCTMRAALCQLQTAAEGVGRSRNGCIMTKNRAHKRAIRTRAARTGERYVVARRTVAEPQRHSPSRMHEFMHSITGVPAHVEGGLQGATPRGRKTHPEVRHKLRGNPRHNEPRVLVAWQNWIARRLRVRTM